MLILTADQINTLVDSLAGSTGDLDRYCEETFGVKDATELDPESLGDIDDAVFLCDECGWWCRIEELGSGDDCRVCDECFEGADECD